MPLGLRTPRPPSASVGPSQQPRRPSEARGASRNGHPAHPGRTGTPAAGRGRGRGRIAFGLDTPGAAPLPRPGGGALPIVDALQLALIECERRTLLVAEQGEARAAVLRAVIAAVRAADAEARVAGVLSSVRDASLLLQRDEQREFARIAALAAADFKALRAAQVARFRPALFADLARVETAARVTVECAEHATFRDVCALRDDVTRVVGDDARAVAVRSADGSGGHCVRLFDGCPFVHTRDCPFHDAAWVEPTTLRDQHFHRRYGRLRSSGPVATAIAARGADASTVYRGVIDARYDRLRNMNCQMFKSRVKHGISTY